MTARGFDLYDLSTPFVAPAATVRPQAVAYPAGRTYWQRLSDSRLFNASVVLLVFAAVLYLVATVLAGFPLGQVTGTQNLGMWLGVILAGLAVAGVTTALLVEGVKRI